MSTADLLLKINALPSNLRKEVEDFIDALLKRKDKETPKQKSIPFGKFKGKIRIADDFDGPMEDFKDYM